MFKKLLELFFTFAKVGVMTFGGGYAMLPILQREVVENKGWATEEELPTTSPSASARPA
jgi:chromate transporter